MIIDSTKYSGACSCGRSHGMQTKFALIESGALLKLPEYMEKFSVGGKTVAIYDENTYRATADRHPAVDTEIILPPENLHANEHGVALVEEKLPRDTKVLLAIGSGTVHDITRYCAHKYGMSFVSCPTAASVDGFCSSVAAMTWGGFKKTFPAVSPEIVIADLDVISAAPLALAVSGFGDMMGKYIALSDWKIANIIKGEYYCERIADMTMTATKTVLAAAEGLASGDKKAFEELTYGLILSGLAMQMTGNSRPASGAEHHISHLIEMNPPIVNTQSAALHGEKVGVGTLILAEKYRELLALDTIGEYEYKVPSDEYILEMFGEVLAPGTREENLGDPAEGITAELINEKLPEIKKVISAIPTKDELTRIYAQIGAKSTLRDIEVRDSLAPILTEVAPLARNRLTLLRILRGKRA